MLSTFRRKLALRHHPELDPLRQVADGHPEARPLRDELFWLVARTADLRANDRDKARAAITDFFWPNLATVQADLDALTSYTSLALHDVGRLAVRGIAGRVAEQGAAMTANDRDRSLALVAQLAGEEQDYSVRLSVAESLPSLLQEPALREAALNIAITQSGDHDYYVSEAALDAIIGLDAAAAGLQRVIETGTAAARVRAPRKIITFAKARPEAVTTPLLESAMKLLTDPVEGIRYAGTTTFLELADLLPDRASQVIAALDDRLDALFPSLVMQFADKASGWSNATVAAQAADLVRRISRSVDLVLSLFHDDRAGVREGAARTIWQLGKLDAAALESLDEYQRHETDWHARIWMSAAIEAVTGEVLPVDRWPVAPAIHQMVFFESENEDTLPAGMRFERGVPLQGHLKHEDGSRYLYWPDDHGVTSSDRLLDDYMPLRVAGDTGDLDDVEVEVTGNYRKHRITVTSVQLRQLRRYQSGARRPDG